MALGIASERCHSAEDAKARAESCEARESALAQTNQSTSAELRTAQAEILNWRAKHEVSGRLQLVSGLSVLLNVQGASDRLDHAARERDLSRQQLSAAEESLREVRMEHSVVLAELTAANASLEYAKVRAE